jgi:hypothetical protein
VISALRVEILVQALLEEVNILELLDSHMLRIEHVSLPYGRLPFKMLLSINTSNHLICGSFDNIILFSFSVRTAFKFLP